MQAIYPTEYEGVKVVSFGYAGSGSAIMRGPMVSGLIQQMLVTTDWGEWRRAGVAPKKGQAGVRECALNYCLSYR